MERMELALLKRSFGTAKNVGNSKEANAGSCSQNFKADLATLMGLKYLRSILPDDLSLQLPFRVISGRIGPLSFGRRSSSALLTDTNVGSE